LGFQLFVVKEQLQTLTKADTLLGEILDSPNAIKAQATARVRVVEVGVDRWLTQSSTPSGLLLVQVGARGTRLRATPLLSPAPRPSTSTADLLADLQSRKSPPDRAARSGCSRRSRIRSSERSSGDPVGNSHRPVAPR